MQAPVVVVTLMSITTLFIFCEAQASVKNCGPNEVYDVCANNCYNTCKEPMKVCPRICGPGACRCHVGYVRQYQGGRCVLYNQCT